MWCVVMCALPNWYVPSENMYTFLSSFVLWVVFFMTTLIITHHFMKWTWILGNNINSEIKIKPIKIHRHTRTWMKWNRTIYIDICIGDVTEKCRVNLKRVREKTMWNVQAIETAVDSGIRKIGNKQRVKNYIYINRLGLKLLNNCQVIRLN